MSVIENDSQNSAESSSGGAARAGAETAHATAVTKTADAGREAEQRARRAAGEAAAELVEPGMVLGLGTGDTAAYAIRAIAARAKADPDRAMKSEQSAQSAAGALWGLRCVATSRRSAELAIQVGLTLIELDELAPHDAARATESAAQQNLGAHAGSSSGPPIDLTIDGADEIDPQLQLVKGAGGALLFEKLVAQSSRRLVIIADPAKRVDHIGEKRLLPVEIVSVGSRHTVARILAVAGVRSATLRRTGEAPYRTDGGNLIVDLQLEAGVHAAELHAQLKVLCGVIETGLFCSEAALALIGNPDGSVTRLGRPNA